MKRAIGITQHHDIENSPMYVRYSDQPVANTKAVDPDEAVLVDFDSDGGVIGIELVFLDEHTIGHAKATAESRGLAFPSNLEHVFPQ